MADVIEEIKENIEEGEEAVEEILEKGEEVIEEVVEKIEEKLGKKEPSKKHKKISKPQKEPDLKEEKKTEEKPKTEDTKTTEKSKVEESRTKGSAPPMAKKEEVKEKPKEVPKTTEKPKKTEAVVRGENIPISTKHSAAICRFIKNKRIEDAISDLEQVMRLKKSVPMKGEIPHRKGKGVMSGKFPQRAVSHFIILLKSLAANSNHNGLENPVIAEAVANIGERPYGRFGRVRKKRSHVRITAKSKKIKEKKTRDKK